MKSKQQDVKYFTKRLGQLSNVYDVYKSMWMQLAEYYTPRTSKFLTSDVNRKPKFSKKIVDSTTGISVRNFASGMMSGATNPAQKWFKFGIKNYQLQYDYKVKNWCADVTELIRRIFNSSNLYLCLPQNYEQMGIFGISVLSVEKDYDTVIHCKVLPVGSYRIAKDYRGKVDTLYRVYADTVSNIVEKFGLENVSTRVKNLYENKRFEEYIEIVHAVEKNFKYNKKAKFADKRKFVSVYFERNGNENKFLQVSGFNHFPYVVFEATVNGEDVYPSNCPGITSFPDVKQLMDQIKDYAKALKKIVSPQLKGPKSLANKKMKDEPASFTPVAETGTETLAPIYQVNPAVLQIKDSINDIRKIISQIWYNDLFVMLNNSDYTQPRTATELRYRKDEAMAQLAPLLQQVYVGAAELIDVVFEICCEDGIIPEPPEQIQGFDTEAEFISTLAQTQKASSIGAVERTVTFAANLASATNSPIPIKKLSLAEIIDDYADYTGVETDNIVPTDVVLKEIKAEQQRAMQQQQIQQEMAALQQGSQIIKNMGGADASGGNLLERIGLQ